MELFKKFSGILVDLIQLSSVRHLILSGSLIILAFVVQELTYGYGERKANLTMMRFLKYSAVFPDEILERKSDYRSILVRHHFIREDTLGDLNVHYATLPLPAVRNCKVQRIYEQLTDVAFRAHNHLLVSKEFMIQSFVCSSTASIFFIIAGVSLAFITKSGFAQANAYFITLLITSIAIGTFFSGLTSIFKQDENAKENMALYVNYINLEQEIRSKIATDKYILEKAAQPCDTVSSLNQAIALIDTKMKDLNRIALGFDAQVVKDLANLGLDKTLTAQ